MVLKELILRNFRNYESTQLKLKKPLTFFIGPNGAGKTNILEAAYILGTTKSFRGAPDRDCICWHKENYFIKGLVASDQGQEMEISVGFSPTNQKHLAIDKKKIAKIKDFFGSIIFVVFSPEDIQLIDGPPILRRRLLDTILSKAGKLSSFILDKENTPNEYLTLLSKYNRLLKIRSKILRGIKSGSASRKDLLIWDNMLIQLSLAITDIRWNLINSVQEQFEFFFNAITGLSVKLELIYESGLGMKQNNSINPLERKKLLESGMAAVLPKEIKLGYTLLGPHRDDLHILADKKDVRIFFSQGQKRALAISYRLTEYEYLKKVSGEIPVLLVDDVIAELDADKKGFFLEILLKAEQALITSTEIDFLKVKLEKRSGMWEVFQVYNGSLTQGNEN
jgi:DNA replication and repair protein RecF